MDQICDKTKPDEIIIAYVKATPWDAEIYMSTHLFKSLGCNNEKCIYQRGYLFRPEEILQLVLDGYDVTIKQVK